MKTIQGGTLFKEECYLRKYGISDKIHFRNKFVSLYQNFQIRIIKGTLLCLTTNMCIVNTTKSLYF